MLAIKDTLADQTAQDTIEVRLEEIRYGARATNLFVFRRPDGAALPPAEAGAHVDVLLPNGLTRQYSLLLDGREPAVYTIGVKRDEHGGGGSRYLHDQVTVGTMLRISSPRNNFRLRDGDHHTVLIAGGIGITPVWSMLHTLSARGQPWELHYSCRTRDDALFADSLVGRSGVHPHFDDEHGGAVLDLAAVVAAAPRGAHFYCCGPAPMLTAFSGATNSIVDDRVHVEYFTPKHEAADGGFLVRLERSGTEHFVPEGCSILDTLRAAGLDMPSSCEQGICGTCETPVLAGVPDHRDSILTESERQANDTMMICCSGCSGDRLVLDL